MSCLVMGIVNVTPDSFSDGGQYFKPEEAVRRACNLAAEGADIVDLGGESTRPGATPLGWTEEWARLEPVLTALVARWRGASDRPRLSVDTYHPETAERALAAGAAIVNCVSSDPAADMLRLCAAAQASLVLPVRLADGIPTVGTVPLADLLARESLNPRPSTCNPRQPTLFLDPMIGFGTTREEDVALLKSVPQLASFGPVLVGASRKRIVKKLTGEKVTGKNLGGNLGLVAWCALHGASVVRVHDVGETVQALKVVAALAEN